MPYEKTQPNVLFTPIDPSDIPGYHPEKSPCRIFAEQVLDELSAADLPAVGAVELTRIPEGIKPAQVAAMLRTVIGQRGGSCPMKVVQRRGRVFVEHVAPDPCRVVSVNPSKRRLRMPTTARG